MGNAPEKNLMDILTKPKRSIKMDNMKILTIAEIKSRFSDMLFR
jgi:hypothetical protein